MQLDQEIRNTETKIQDCTECIGELRSLNLKLCDGWRIFKTTIENTGEVDDGYVHF